MVILLHYLMVRKTAPPPAAAAIAAPQPPTRRQRTTLRMRLVFGGHFWQGIKVGRGLSLQFSGELANVLCIIQSVASYALLLLHCITGWTVNDVFFATIFEISRLARPKFEISISMTSQPGSRHH